jgi:hypothetical protein
VQIVLTIVVIALIVGGWLAMHAALRRRAAAPVDASADEEADRDSR